MRPTGTGMFAAGTAGWAAGPAPFDRGMALVPSALPSGAGGIAMGAVPVCAAAGRALPLLAVAAVPAVVDGAGTWGR